MEIKLLAKTLYALSCVYGKKAGTKLFITLIKLIEEENIKNQI